MIPKSSKPAHADQLVQGLPQLLANIIGSPSSHLPGFRKSLAMQSVSSGFIVGQEVDANVIQQVGSVSWDGKQRLRRLRFWRAQSFKVYLS